MLKFELVNGNILATEEDCYWHFRKAKRVDTVILQVERIFERNGQGVAPDFHLWPQYAVSSHKVEFFRLRGYFLTAAYKRIAEIEKAEGKFGNQRMTNDFVAPWEKQA